jgi:transcriptional regulator with XRE-family HTH domain
MEHASNITNIGAAIVTLRREMRLSQTEFGAAIGLTSKGRVSVLESTGRASLPVALRIEELSIADGVPRIDAAALNDDVARARAACAGGCASGDDEAVLDHAALDNASDAPASTGQIGQMSRAVAA